MEAIEPFVSKLLQDWEMDAMGRLSKLIHLERRQGDRMDNLQQKEAWKFLF